MPHALACDAVSVRHRKQRWSGLFRRFVFGFDVMRFNGSLCARAACLVAVLAFALLLPATARADAFSDALKGFTTDEYSDTVEAIEAIAKSDSPRAAPVIEALAAEKLFFIGDPAGVFIDTGGGKYVDAATGATATPAKDPELVRQNNRVRSLVDSVVGDLTLLSPDAAKRRDAAASVFRSRNPAALPALEQAIAAEKDASIKARWSAHGRRSSPSMRTPPRPTA